MKKTDMPKLKPNKDSYLFYIMATMTPREKAYLIEVLANKNHKGTFKSIVESIGRRKGLDYGSYIINIKKQ